ncbi:hypothetical protein HDV63DRAFT_364404 [Trichoderma sp. SZMC 28014]
MLAASPSFMLMLVWLPKSPSFSLRSGGMRAKNTDLHAWVRLGGSYAASAFHKYLFNCRHSMARATSDTAS